MILVPLIITFDIHIIWIIILFNRYISIQS